MPDEEEARAPRGTAPAPPPGAGGAPPTQPRPMAADAESAEAGAPLQVPLPPGGFPGVFVGEPIPPRPQRSVSSMLFLTMFFFFMSQNGQNQGPLGPIGPDGEVHERVTELSLLRRHVREYEGFLNGTGNWTEPATPDLLPSAIVPARFDHSDAAARGAQFFPNITGWYRRAQAHGVDLVTEEGARDEEFFRGVRLPALNASGEWNDTRADELGRNEFAWANVSTWDLRVNMERAIVTDKPKRGHKGHEREDGEVEGSEPELPIEGEIGSPDDTVTYPPEWAWVRAQSTITVNPMDKIEYRFYGLHHIPNGTYELFGLPDGMRIDIRHIPPLFPEHHNETAHMVLAELRRELQKQEDSLLLTDVKPDDTAGIDVRCPLLMHLSLPPLPPGVRLEDVLRYDAELAHPTGLLPSLKRPPGYWQGIGLGGIVVADQCGFAIGFERGRGVPQDDFWRKTINYATYATLSQLLVLFLLVRQMERTRTPSTLAKVSLWTIVIIALSDSTIFSTHLIISVITDNKTGLPLMVPSFVALCTAIVFGPRYAVLLHRIQAPERTVSRSPRRRRTPSGAGAAAPGAGAGDNAENAAETGTNADESDSDDEDDEPGLPWTDRLGNALSAYPGLKWFGAITIFFMFGQIALMPRVIPFVLFATQSIWVPQIYRNARRGSNGALAHSFIFGTSIGRLALPLYALACPENVYVVDTANWVWILVAWQAIQVAMILAQDRFGPAFFLPKRYKPAEGYDYHPILPAGDAENAGDGWAQGEKTCSICMEEVVTSPAELADGGGAGAGGASSTATASAAALLNLNTRRAYAVAPCHHLFHTKCLQQWMTVKTICPLCKRPLPPL